MSKTKHSRVAKARAELERAEALQRAPYDQHGTAAIEGQRALTAAVRELVDAEEDHDG